MSLSRFRSAVLAFDLLPPPFSTNSALRRRPHLSLLTGRVVWQAHRRRGKETANRSIYGQLAATAISHTFSAHILLYRKFFSVSGVAVSVRPLRVKNAARRRYINYCTNNLTGKGSTLCSDDKHCGNWAAHLYMHARTLWFDPLSARNGAGLVEASHAPRMQQ